MDAPIFVEVKPSTRRGSVINPLTNQPGCYVVKHEPTGVVYVGSSKNLAARITSNLSALKNGTHKNPNLQQVYTKREDMAFFVAQTKTREEAFSLEQQMVDRYKDKGILCNIATDNVAHTRVGVPLTADHLEKLKQSNINRAISDDTRKRLSESHLGQIVTEEQKENLSKLALQRLSTPEGKAAHFEGIKKLMHPVVINGVRYNSKSEAARTLGVDVTTVMYRIKSPNYPDCFVLGGE